MGDNDVVNQARQKFSGVDAVLNQFGAWTLESYTGTFRENRAVSLQPREDLFDVAEALAARLLGRDTAAAFRKELEKSPVVITANHHGVTYHPVIVQGNLIFSLPALSDASTQRVVPVFAFGAVPLNNTLYPRGILLSRLSPGPGKSGAGGQPIKFSLFPDREKHTLVSAAHPVDRLALSRALDKLLRLFRQGCISKREKQGIETIILGQYSDPAILSLENYSDQSVVLNHGLWKRLFSQGWRHPVPEMVHLEMEKIVSALLELDLQNSNSLVYRLFFDRALRSALMTALDRQTGCWHLENALSGLCTGGEVPKKKGTAFFWGVDAKGRGISLSLGCHNGKWVLEGGNAAGSRCVVDFTPDALLSSLKAGTLLPSLFTSFAVVAFSRGIRCFGGFWQIAYLPVMKQGISYALKATRGYGDWVEPVQSVPVQNYVAGKIVAVVQYGSEAMRPAGIVEIAQSGGLGKQDFEKISRLTVYEANLHGLVEVYRGFCKGDGLPGHRLKEVLGQIDARLENRLVQLKIPS